MKPSAAKSLVLSAVMAGLAAPLSAQHSTSEPTPAVISTAKRSAHDHLLYDTRGDGSLWARGASYKASFDATGATYYPYFGKRAPHDMPHVLTPDSVTSGGAPIAFERTAPIARDGDRVEIDRGAFVETYDLALDSVEQSFVFTSLPGRGDLVVHVPIASEMQPVATESGVDFRGEFGSVSYERAVAIDASGERSVLTAHIEDGAITLRVGADFLAHATLPLVIDPFVSTVFVTGIANDDFQPDAAWDPFNQEWMVVYEETFSASDTDVYANFYDFAGTFLGQAGVDVSGEAWASPRCAQSGSAHNFFVVAERTDTTLHSIVGRTVEPNGTAFFVGPESTISNGGSGSHHNPSVGGDPNFSGPTYYLVAWTDTVASSGQIFFRTVNSGGAPTSVVQSVPSLGTDSDDLVSVSKSNDTIAWFLSWRRVDPITHGDIWAERVRWDGVVLDPAFGITSAGLDSDSAPCVSSPLHNTAICAIAFTRNHIPSPNHDVLVAVLNDTNVLQIASVTGLDQSGSSGIDNLDPAIDSDGGHFLVAYSQRDPITGTYAAYGTELYLAGTQLGLLQGHVQFHQFGLDEHNSHMSAAHDFSSSRRRFFSVYDVLENPTNHDVAGALFDAVQGGTVSSFCAGTAATCPCGNVGTAFAGCANSVNAGGGALGATGIASTVHDTLVLTATGLPPSASCLFFQGSSSAATAFGDGVRCVNGSIIRLATRTATSIGAATYPAPVDQPISGRGMLTLDGGQRGYQVWYRNPAAFCTSAVFNITNGILVDWTR